MILSWPIEGQYMTGILPALLTTSSRKYLLQEKASLFSIYTIIFVKIRITLVTIFLYEEFFVFHSRAEIDLNGLRTPKGPSENFLSFLTKDNSKKRH